MGRIDIDVCENIVEFLLDRGAHPNLTDRVRMNVYLLVQTWQNRPTLSNSCSGWVSPPPPPPPPPIVR
jgi:hypothetical protein